MHTPRRTVPLFAIWDQWATAAVLGLLSDNPALVDLHLKVTMLTTLQGMLNAKYGPSPASTGGSPTKD